MVLSYLTTGNILSSYQSYHIVLLSHSKLSTRNYVQGGKIIEEMGEGVEGVITPGSELF